MNRALRMGRITAVSALQVTADHGPLPPPRTVDQFLVLTDKEWEAYEEPARSATKRREGGHGGGQASLMIVHIEGS